MIDDLKKKVRAKATSLKEAIALITTLHKVLLDN